MTPHNHRDLTGRRFGRLLVVERTDAKTANGIRLWLCRCDCGSTASVRTTCLNAGQTRSCGCLRGESRGNQLRTHGGTGSRVYNAFRSMWDRCANVRSKAYPDYGGRGIRVCERWRSFEAFRNDMGDPPDGFSLDRIEVNGDYEPTNCRWADDLTQNNNRRSSVPIRIGERSQGLKEWCRELGLPYPSVYSRVRRGWTPSEALGLSPRSNAQDAP